MDPHRKFVAYNFVICVSQISTLHLDTKSQHLLHSTLANLALTFNLLFSINIITNLHHRPLMVHLPHPCTTPIVTFKSVCNTTKTSILFLWISQLDIRLPLDMIYSSPGSLEHHQHLDPYRYNDPPPWDRQ